MSLTITDEVLHSAGMSEAEMRREIAVMLYQAEKLTLARAARLADMPRIRFQHLLASRDVAIHYDEMDLEQDLATLHVLECR
ncbi:MAG TPA: UPF0175 family protein [Longimicrobiaceae bacterium]|jgi:predicted HTH domain antitoxin